MKLCSVRFMLTTGQVENNIFSINHKSYILHSQSQKMVSYSVKFCMGYTAMNSIA
jgi:hypothetical protein